MFLGFLTMKKRAAAAQRKAHLPARNDRPEYSGNGSAPPFSEEFFARLLSLEQKRAERSRKPFALMLIDAGKLLRADPPNDVLDQLAVALSSSTRETDLCGWYKEGAIIGIIFTEIGSTDANALRTMMLSKVESALRIALGPARTDEIQISFHVFPEDLNSRNGGSTNGRLYLYPDLHHEDTKKRAARLIKRMIDIVGSLAALILASPLFLFIAMAIKLTSRGPVLFKQERIGQFGERFTCLKFRSMHTRSDPKIHEEYVRRFISGKNDCKQSDATGSVYKLKHDPRITPVGRFLRRTSLDEIPQFYNVLRGEMSLVGPRPPIPYETEVYDLWHRRRFLESKPGVTGLWQVKGRSKVTFDEMVRLDIRYARNWSLGLDFKILLETPRAVFFGKGAR